MWNAKTDYIEIASFSAKLRIRHPHVDTRLAVRIVSVLRPCGRENLRALWSIPRPAQTARVSPVTSNLRKSDGLVVAKEAPICKAVAAIMQSTKEPRRRPDSLNSRAATKALSSLKGTRTETTRAARSRCDSSSGPHRNSAQPMALMPSGSPSRIQVRRVRSSGEPPTSARIRKPVSRWITPRQLLRRRSAARRSARTPSSQLPATSPVSPKLSWSSCNASSTSCPAGGCWDAAARIARRKASDLDTFQRRAMASSWRTVSTSKE